MTLSRFSAFALEICDDGVGFEPVIANLSGGCGLSGMVERALRVGGSLQIETALVPGTKVSVRIHVGSRENGGRK